MKYVIFYAVAFIGLTGLAVACWHLFFDILIAWHEAQHAVKGFAP